MTEQALDRYDLGAPLELRIMLAAVLNNGIY